MNCLQQLIAQAGQEKSERYYGAEMQIFQAGDQGAINKFLIGEWSAGAHDIETSLGNVFSNDLIPALKAFIQQFATDFGSKALAQAAPLAAQVIAGSLTIQQAGTQLVAQVGPVITHYLTGDLT